MSERADALRGWEPRYVRPSEAGFLADAQEIAETKCLPRKAIGAPWRSWAIDLASALAALLAEGDAPDAGEASNTRNSPDGLA